MLGRHVRRHGVDHHHGSGGFSGVHHHCGLAWDADDLTRGLTDVGTRPFAGDCDAIAEGPERRSCSRQPHPHIWFTADTHSAPDPHPNANSKQLPEFDPVDLAEHLSVR